MSETTKNTQGHQVNERADGRVTVVRRGAELFVFVKIAAGRDEPDLERLAAEFGFSVGERGLRMQHFCYDVRPTDAAYRPDEAVEQIVAWVEAWDGQPTGIADGVYHGYEIRRNGGHYLVACERALAGPLNQIDGAVRSARGTAVPFRSESALRALLERAAKTAEKAGGFTFAEVPGIEVTVDGALARVSFAYDADAVAGIRGIPGATFDGDRRCWTVSMRNREKLQAWLTGVLAARAAREAAQAEQATRSVEQRHASAQVGATALKSLRLTHSRVSVLNGKARVWCARDEQLIADFKRLRGRWDSHFKVWSFGVERGVELAELLTQAEARLAGTAQAEADAAAATAAAAAADRAANPHVTEIPPRAARPGVTFRLADGTAVTCERLGPEYTCEDPCDIRLGLQVVDVFYRTATADEAAALDKREVRSAEGA